MRIFDLISMCLRNLFRRKARTLLTVAGVIIGTCSIVVMISLGVGMSNSQDEMLKQMGDLTLIYVNNYGAGQNDVKLNDEAVESFKSMEHVAAVTPHIEEYDLVEIVSGKKERYMFQGSITGIDVNAMEAFGYKLSEGRYLQPNDKEATVWVGQNAAYQFVDTKKKGNNNMVWPEPDANGNIPKPFVDMLNDSLLMRVKTYDDESSSGGDVMVGGGMVMYGSPKLTVSPLSLDPGESSSGSGEDSGSTKPKTKKKNEYKLNVIGVMEEDFNKGSETGYGILMDIKLLKKLQDERDKLNKVPAKDRASEKGYTTVWVKADDIDHVAEIEQAIKDMGYNDTWSLSSSREAMQDYTRNIQMVLGGLGAISMLVAALGIANTMIMSIYERTREIGIMKVLGCQVGNIRSLFLMEAGSIGLMGGILGVGISYGLSFALNHFLAGTMGGMDAQGAMMDISVIPPWLVLLGMAFAVGVGLVSGFYPANRAVKISALEAIKHD
ncbi:ABC transporter permease [Zongyangia hominis]|uniref:ABC transporter permease n=1 Tax=Zongyangia hominis TaxID=2763677 RepID=A0A926E7M0_9FIRM|nr:ABC transporter permease [Zongyangia hominis]MBC8569330.1 ABC transporter permease [Zongyangia hominis]